MRPRRAGRAALLLALVVAPIACSSPASEPPPESVPGETSAEDAGAPVAAEEAVPEPVVDEDADEIVRRMGRTLAEAERFSFRVEATRDEFLADGRGIEVSSDVRVAVRRPGCLRAEMVSDRGHRVLQFDGTNFGVTDLAKNVYVQGRSPSPWTVEDLLDALSEDFGVHVPLADLLTDDPYTALTDGLEDARYVGRHVLRGVACDHVAGTTGGIDWQVWVPAEGPAVPAKVSLHSTGEDGSERFSALLSDWNLSDETPDGAFAFTPPAGGRRIRMSRRVAAETAGGDR